MNKVKTGSVFLSSSAVHHHPDELCDDRERRSIKAQCSESEKLIEWLNVLTLRGVFLKLFYRVGPFTVLAMALNLIVTVVDSQSCCCPKQTSFSFTCIWPSFFVFLNLAHLFWRTAPPPSPPLLGAWPCLSTAAVPLVPHGITLREQDCDFTDFVASLESFCSDVAHSHLQIYQ